MPGPKEPQSQVIVGATSLDQLKENLDAFEGWPWSTVQHFMARLWRALGISNVCRLPGPSSVVPFLGLVWFL